MLLAFVGLGINDFKALHRHIKKLATNKKLEKILMYTSVSKTGSILYYIKGADFSRKRELILSISNRREIHFKKMIYKKD